MKFQIWASAPGERQKTDGGITEFEREYATSTAAAGRAEMLLCQGREVHIVPVADDADPPPPGGGERRGGRPARHTAVPEAG